ncbi:MAG TPA: class I SAM-dependent methyltransferase [Dissulfurispiraceae bacterium]|nr:class I SAM-dependent methyltransferase [Dissulfurispiraceae bacterium]
MEERRDFNKEAGKWDQNAGRVKLANDVADAIIKLVSPDKDMDVLDFGCGTGLVTLRLQPYVRSVTGVDSSEGMIKILTDKISQQKLANVRTQLVDFEKGEKVVGTYDLVVSSMTAHHVPDTGALFNMWRDLLKREGRLCFADLDAEDGMFHGDNTGVFHFGFDREKLKRMLADAGFRGIHATTASKVVRDIEGGAKKEFSVFLIDGRT